MAVNRSREEFQEKKIDNGIDSDQWSGYNGSMAKYLNNAIESITENGAYAVSSDTAVEIKRILSNFRMDVSRCRSMDGIKTLTDEMCKNVSEQLAALLSSTNTMDDSLITLFKSLDEIIESTVDAASNPR